MELSNVLVIVDMQNDFITGSLGSREACSIVDNVVNKVTEYVNSNRPIYYTKDTHGQNYLDSFEGKNLPVPHCIDGNYGWRLTDKLETFLKEYPNAREVIKRTFGSFAWSTKNFITDAGIEIMQADPIWFKGGSIEICGLCTDICVISNALIIRAMYPETVIKLDSSCCADSTPENHDAALKVLKSCQIEVY